MVGLEDWPPGLGRRWWLCRRCGSGGGGASGAGVRFFGWMALDPGSKTGHLDGLAFCGGAALRFGLLVVFFLNKNCLPMCVLND